MGDSTSDEQTVSTNGPATERVDSETAAKKPEKAISSTMTDEERLELAAKLDKDLDDFIAGLEKKRYADGWNEDEWEEQIKKHPFFMKEPPKPGEELHPLFEGMQKLKYDPQENTSEELALAYKEDGNWYMKYKKFRTAILAYTEGLKFKCLNQELNATLYNNRSAANYCLKNYGSALKDAKKALELKPDYLKPLNRAAVCCGYLDRFEECKTFCFQLLDLDPMNDEIHNLLQEVGQREYFKQRSDRRFQFEQQKKQDRWKELLKALKQRQLRFWEKRDVDSLEDRDVTPYIPPLENVTVSLRDDNSLVWPAAFAYPEFEMMDFEQELSENATMNDCLVALLEELKYDVMGKYKLESVNVYYENKAKGTTHLVDREKTILQIIQEDTFLICQGTLMFFILAKDTDDEQHFLDQERKGFERYAPVV